VIRDFVRKGISAAVVSSPDAVRQASKSVLRLVARLMGEAKPLAVYPGWRFAIEEQNPTTEILARSIVWTAFRDRQITDPVRVRWERNLKVDLTLGNDQSRCLYVGGSFEPNELTFISERLSAGMRFVDVGASEGFYSLIASRLVGPQGRVFAFEPSPRERARLQRNIAINNLANVSVFDCALADEEGQARFLVAEAEHNGLNTLGAFAYDGVACAEQLSVRVRQLDGILKSSGTTTVDMIKIDVEGAELRVLKGALDTLKRFRPTILMELLESALRKQNTSSDEVLDFLKNIGYRIWTFDDSTGRIRPAKPAEALSSNIVAQAQ
jgi:FkbM family methyltransferase